MEMVLPFLLPAFFGGSCLVVVITFTKLACLFNSPAVLGAQMETIGHMLAHLFGTRVIWLLDPTHTHGGNDL